MALMVLCGLLLLVGLAVVVRWGAFPIRPPGDAEATGRLSPAEVARRYVRSVTVAVAAGVGSGVLVAGPGGRLAMRLLAATSGDAAQGRLTEADEVVGRISVGGTIGLVIFVALFFGLSTGFLFVLVRRWLPAGRLGGFSFGVLLLLLASTRIDPLRAENPDFDIVAPGWLAAAVFGGLVLLHGMLVAAIAGRYGAVLPLIAFDRRAVFAHAPLLALVPLVMAVPVLLVVGVVGVGASRLQPLVDLLRSRATLVVGRVLLAGLGLVALPSWVVVVADIVGSRP